tara:strand:+ start:1186 stop:2529 length:1344 start_codon:yes stop_codon:yes gene_type:complete
VRPTAAGVLQLLSEAIATVPELSEYALDETWAGLRPTTPDLAPLLGRTLWRNALVAGGYHRNGILLSPLCAKLTADCIEGTLEPRQQRLFELFSPSRFIEGRQHAPAYGKPKGASTDATRAATPNARKRSMLSWLPFRGRAPPASAPPASAPSAPRTPAPPTPTRAPPAPAPAAPVAAASAVPLGAPASASSASPPPPFYDPQTNDIGDSVARSLAANRKFIEKLESDPSGGYGYYEPELQPTPVAATPLADPIDPVDPEAPLLWRVNDDGTRTPIYRGQPPEELLQGYGDTVLPPPIPEEAKAALREIAAEAEKREASAQIATPEMSPPPAAVAMRAPKQRGAPSAAATAITSSRYVPPAAQGGLTANGKVASTAAAAKGAELSASEKLNTVDAYDVIAETQTQRDEAITGAYSSNVRLGSDLEGDDGELMAAVEADLAAFRDTKA